MIFNGHTRSIRTCLDVGKTHPQDGIIVGVSGRSLCL